MNFINLGTRNKGTFWEYLAAHAFLLTKLPGSNFSINYFLGIGEGIANKHCHSTIDITKNSNIFISEFKKGIYTNSYFDALVRVYLDEFKILKKTCISKNFKLFSNEALADTYVKVSNALASPNLPMLQSLYTLYLNDFFNKELKKVLDKKEKEDQEFINKIKIILLSKEKSTIIDEEEKYLYHLRRLYIKNFKDNGTKMFFKNVGVEQKFKMMAKKCGWLHMEYAQKAFTEQTYKKYFEETLDTEKNRQPFKKDQIEIKKQKELFFKNHPSVYFKNLTLVLQKFAYVLDHSKDIVIHGHYLSLPLFEEISKRLAITSDDLLFLVPPETVQYLLLAKKVGKKLINSRKEKRVVLLRENLVTWFEGDEAKFITKKYFNEETFKKINSLKGISAYPGIVIGKAVIIKSILDYDKFKKGDILITHDGTAELTIFLKKAGAIVTNEGGMICHSANIAREMKTPCVVGTKFATKFIKNGDIVEVDADKGIIKKIKEKI